MGGVQPPSIYASSYESSLNKETKNADYHAFQQAITEQICERFVGYRLDILPNHDEYDSFRVARLKLWELIDLLVRSRLEE